MNTKVPIIKSLSLLAASLIGFALLTVNSRADVSINKKAGEPSYEATVGFIERNIAGQSYTSVTNGVTVIYKSEISFGNGSNHYSQLCQFSSSSNVRFITEKTLEDFNSYEGFAGGLDPSSISAGANERWGVIKISCASKGCVSHSFHPVPDPYPADSSPGDALQVYVAPAMTQRVANAFRHLIHLCGAKEQPF